MKKQFLLTVLALCRTVTLALFAGAVTLDSAELAENGDAASLFTAAVVDNRTVYVDANSVYTLLEDEVVTDIDLGNTRAVYDASAGTITAPTSSVPALLPDLI